MTMHTIEGVQPALALEAHAAKNKVGQRYPMPMAMHFGGVNVC